MACLYCHINKLNNKKYIGITKYSDPQQRWGSNGEGYKGSYFYDKGISQFGWDGFEHITLNDDIDYTSAQQLEARLIKSLNTTSAEFGYNESEGIKIIPNNTWDLICDSLIKTKLTPKTNDAFLLETAYRHTTPQYTLKYIFSLFKDNRINTDLDCQRGYVWTEDRQQGMWDTLLFGHRIPELHAIRQGLDYDIIDGKQRLTTVIKILNNEIPCKKAYASLSLIPLFEAMNKTSFMFKDLPEYLQERILNTSIYMAEYSDMKDEEMISLFKKLNASMPLNEFQKSIADYIPLRFDFTRYLISHPTIQKIFTDREVQKSEDEKYLIRVAILIKNGLNVNLQPREMANYYDSLKRADLKISKDVLLKYLDMIGEHIEILSNFRSLKSYLPIMTYIIYERNMSSNQIKSFFEKVKEANYPGRGDDLGRTTINNRYNTLIKLLEN